MSRDTTSEIECPECHQIVPSIARESHAVMHWGSLARLKSPEADEAIRRYKLVTGED